MGILDTIWNAFKKAFGHSVDAAKKTFEELEDEVQDNGIDGSKFAEIIKHNTEAEVEYVDALLQSTLKATKEAYDNLMFELRVKYKIPEALSVIRYFQIELHETTDNDLHNSKCNELSNIAAIILSKGKLSWLTLLMGVGEYIYRKFVKGEPVKISLIQCPKGQIPDGKGGCMNDPIPPDPTHPQ